MTRQYKAKCLSVCVCIDAHAQCRRICIAGRQAGSEACQSSAIAPPTRGVPHLHVNGATRRRHNSGAHGRLSEPRALRTHRAPIVSPAGRCLGGPTPPPLRHLPFCADGERGEGRGVTHTHTLTHARTHSLTHTH